MNEQVVLSAKSLTKSFPIDGKKRRIVVNDLNLDMFKGETLSLVGESGCGKSTLARLFMRLIRPDSGEIIFDGVNVSDLSENAFRPYRKRIQMVFQDPASSLDPRMKVRDIIAEPLRIWNVCKDNKEIDERVLELLDMVELKESAANKYPHEFSGGQKQRIGIARAIAISPDLLICDESVSALDVSVQAQILNLLKRLKRELGLSCLFISHDLSVVNFISDRVCVMKDGKICEIADAQSIYKSPAHEYTRFLLAAIPTIEYAE
ncbi:ATP-binding cassette domain-containing protein [Butyrivibrio sp. AD3002]|uniref:ATP-binding cassette domain-containing protein n=1 Tax=Butyrivibrio sp. AD3002 TaxID=1280670 RepID=UPI0003B76CFE|nr:ATP-binding cassette domain-containing protein [Butyrivibrio sp. AD3002]